MKTDRSAFLLSLSIGISSGILISIAARYAYYRYFEFETARKLVLQQFN
jgi:hypothetical protein